MSLRPNNLPPVQDMPPPGGYPEIKSTRILKPRGLTGWQAWGLLGGMICYGFYQVKKGNQERNYQKLAERQIRYNLAPFLQAEADRLYMQREAEILKKEAEVMKDVPGWEVGKNPYNSGVWMPRHVYDLSRDIK